MTLALTSRRAALAPGPWVRNELWRRARAVPSLDLRFADTKSLVDATTGSNLVTFTRASSGTFVGSNGVLQTAVTNLLVQSEDFSTTWSATRASVSTNAVAAPNGTTTADKIVEDSTADNSHFISQTATIANATAYTFSCFVKAAERFRFRLGFSSAGFGSTINASFNLQTSAITASAGVTASIIAYPDGWFRCVATATSAAASTPTFSMLLLSDAGGSGYTGDGTSGLFVWGAQLEQSSSVGEYIPTTSTINSAPRFDHNPTTGESLGLLVEEQRTNLLVQSNGFDTTWTNVNSSETAASGTAPDGTNTAWELKDTVDVSSVPHALRQSVSITSGVTYTFTWWAKAGTLSETGTSFAAAGFTSALTCRISLTNGSVLSTSAGLTTNAVAFPNGWYRCSATATATASASTAFDIRIMNGGTTYQGDGNGTILVWGAQLEAGAFPTSVIPTTTATVTRSADVASISGSNFSAWYRQDEGTMFTSWTAAGFTIRPFTVNDGTGNNAISVATTTTNAGQSIYVSGSFQGTAGIAGSYASGTSYRQGAAYRSNDAVDAINGTLGAVDTSCSVPSVTQALIGQGRNGASQPSNGTIRRLTFWPTRLPNSTLQAVTQ